MTTARFDLMGQRFERLVVVGRAESHGKQGARWRCCCDCGAETTVASHALRVGLIKSCGCWRLDMQDRMRRSRRGAGWAENGQRTPTYRVWTNMKTRCNNPRASGYEYYGGRGIKVCTRWADSFDAFLADMGERPEGMSIERDDFNGNYEPGNCRWATAAEQARNSRRVKLTAEKRARLTEMRARGDSQQAVADAIGVSQGAVTDFERGKTWWDAKQRPVYRKGDKA